MSALANTFDTGAVRRAYSVQHTRWARQEKTVFAVATPWFETCFNTLSIVTRPDVLHDAALSFDYRIRYNSMAPCDEMTRESLQNSQYFVSLENFMRMTPIEPVENARETVVRYMVAEGGMNQQEVAPPASFTHTMPGVCLFWKMSDAIVGVAFDADNRTFVHAYSPLLLKTS